MFGRHEMIPACLVRFIHSGQSLQNKSYFSLQQCLNKTKSKKKDGQAFFGQKWLYLEI